MGRLKAKTRNELVFLFLALPSLIGMLVFFIAPFAYSLYLAVIDNPVGRNFVGLRHFEVTLRNDAFMLGMRNTLIFMGLSVPINMAFPLLIAMALRKLPNRGLFGMFFLIPLVIPSGSMVHFWHSVFGIHGSINGFLFAAEPINWLNTDFAITVILVIFMWKNAGFNVVLFQAGLDLIPKEYYECAQMEGAGRWKLFRSVTLVYLAPTMFMVLLMSILATFRSFREIYLLSGAHPHRSIYMLQHYMNNMFAALNYQRLASAAYILAAGIVLVMIGVFWLQKRVTNYD